MASSTERSDARWALVAQRGLHDRTRPAFSAARASGIDGHFHVSASPGLLVALTSAPGLGFLNTVTVLDDAALGELPAVLAEFQGAGVTQPTVIAPDDEPARAGRLVGLGLRAAGTRPFAYRRLETAQQEWLDPESGRVRVRPVRSPQERALFADVLLAGYEASPEVGRFIRADHSGADVDAYLAWIDDQPVAGAAMSWHAGGVVLGGAATLAPHRGAGAQSALLRARLRDAAVCGSTHPSGVVLAAATAAPGSPSSRNLQRAGFAVNQRRVWRTEP